MLREKNLKANEGVIFYRQNICSILKVFGVFGKQLKANLGVRCYLLIFQSFLKLLGSCLLKLSRFQN